jgi:hypothetical protein
MVARGRIPISFALSALFRFLHRYLGLADSSGSRRTKVLAALRASNRRRADTPTRTYVVYPGLRLGASIGLAHPSFGVCALYLWSIVGLFGRVRGQDMCDKSWPRHL